MIPHNRALVETYKDKPFALIGINSDGSRSALQKIIKEQNINYRNAVDGSTKGTKGPIAKAWNISGWPTIYVIDAAGVIRAQVLGADNRKLTEAIEAALKK